MAMSAEHRSNRQWWHLQMSEKFLSGTKNKQINEEDHKFIYLMSFRQVDGIGPFKVIKVTMSTHIVAINVGYIFSFT